MRKLALIAAVVVLVVLSVRLWPDRSADVTPAPAAPTASTPPAPAPRPATIAPTTPSWTDSATATTGPYGGTDEARRAWEPVVQGFALAYPDTSGLTRKQWLASLRPYLEEDVIDALSETDLEKVPDGRYAGYQLLKVADEAITVRVAYQEGWALVLYLVALGDGTWSVQAFDTALDFD